MAVKDSNEIATNSNYALGDYSFRIERSSVPGSTNDKIEAICTDKDGKNARKSIQIASSSQLNGWYVEANESEVTVYAVIKEQEGGGETSDLDTGNLTQPISSQKYAEDISLFERNQRFWQNAIDASNGAFVPYCGNHALLASSSPCSINCCSNYNYNSPPPIEWTPVQLNNTFTHNGKTVYYTDWLTLTGWDSGSETYITNSFLQTYNNIGYLSNPAQVAWTIIYGAGGEYGDAKEVMIARFAIDLEDAGGDGPGSDWIDPGDYDPDWEPEDPTHTLYVEVTGALSGRHNDPIEDPNYSYIPADKDTVKDYGCGGDGGHGGGGGAGASTVVVHKFATNQANSKEVTAIARRHGYGSGGGKGGKGGDGCILVYY